MIRLRKWEEEAIDLGESYDHQEMFQAAIDKIKHVAVRFDSQKAGYGDILAGFRAYLTPLEFKKKVVKSFDIYLSPEEVGDTRTSCFSVL